jgi:hypothetical protein
MDLVGFYGRPRFCLACVNLMLKVVLIRDYVSGYSLEKCDSNIHLSHISMPFSFQYFLIRHTFVLLVVCANLFPGININ